MGQEPSSHTTTVITPGTPIQSTQPAKTEEPKQEPAQTQPAEDEESESISDTDLEELRRKHHERIKMKMNMKKKKKFIILKIFQAVRQLSIHLQMLINDCL